MIRSLLFVPADSERKIARALDCDADALIIDLEDSVAPLARSAARTGIKGLANADRSIFVRVNPIGSPDFVADLEAAMTIAPFGIVLPKSRGGRDVAELHARPRRARSGQRVEVRLDENTADRDRNRGGDARGVELFGKLKQAVGIDLGGRGPRDRYRGAGEAKPWRHSRERPSILRERNACLAPQPPGSWPSIPSTRTSATPSGFAAECEAAMRDGFVGKMVVHPDQIEPTNAAFVPSAEAVADANAVIAAFDAAPGAGVVTLDGRMLDRPHLDLARRILARARR